MINRIKSLLVKPNYIDIRLLNRSSRLGVRLVKIPINKIWLGIAIGLILLCLITPFTNWLIPVILYKLIRF